MGRAQSALRAPGGGGGAAGAGVGAGGLRVTVPVQVTVWDFSLPLTPSHPALFGFSDLVFEQRFGLQRGCDDQSIPPKPCVSPKPLLLLRRAGPRA